MELTLRDEATVTVLLDDPDAAFEEICASHPNLRVEQTSAGEVIIMSPAGNESSFRNLEILAQLRNWAKRDGRGKVFDSNTVFRLPDGSKLGPDGAWVARSRYASFSPGERKEFLPLAPDLVVELKSQADRMPVLQRKMESWIANGVAAAWLIDADARLVWIYSAGQAVRKLEAPAVVPGQGPIAGFELVMNEIYIGLDD